MKRRRGLCAAVVALAIGAAGCGGNSNASAPAAAGVGDRVDGVLTVHADSSLREVFQNLAVQTEQEHPKLKVRLSFFSEGLVTPADVVATASSTDLASLHATDAVGDPTVFAQEVLALVVAPNNPGHVATLGDLRHPGVSVAVCRSVQECGGAADSVLQRADVGAADIKRVTDSEAALAAVSSARVDAALVWTNEVRGVSGESSRERGVRTVVLSADPQENIRLAGLGSRALLVGTARAGNQLGAAAFVGQLRSPAAQQLLRLDGYR